MKSKIYYLVAVVVVFFGILMVNKTAKAQCPCPTDIPPTELAWHSKGPVEVTVVDNDTPPNACTYLVWYCYRTYDDISPEPFLKYVEVFICDIQPKNGACNNLNLTPFQIRKYCAEDIIRYNPDNLDWPAPLCPDFNPHYSTFLFGCYDGVQWCGNTYCQYTYKVCVDNLGHRKVTEAGHTRIGPDCPAGCYDQCQ